MDSTRRRLLQTSLAAFGLLALPLRAAAAPVTRGLRYTLSFYNPTQEEKRDQRFHCYLPAELGPRQRLRSVSVSIPHQLLHDDYGHAILRLDLPPVPPLGRRIVALSLQLELADRSDTSSGSGWLAGERHIETGDGELRAIAAGLRRDTAEATARAIYDHVRGHLRYAGFIAEDLGAAYAQRERRGDCTEYAYLVVALARINGIPARMAGGYVSARDFVPRVQDYHNWAELLLGDEWVIVDAQKEYWRPPRQDWIVYRLYREQADNVMGGAHRYRMDGELKVEL